MIYWTKQLWPLTWCIEYATWQHSDKLAPNIDLARATRPGCTVRLHILQHHIEQNHARCQGQTIL